VRRASLLVNALAAIVVLAIVLTARPPQGPAFDLVDASGALQVTNSRAGEAIFHGDRLRPGQQVVGALTLTNTGEVRAALAVDAVVEEDDAGTQGGRLSNALWIVVSDVTDPRAPFVVYDGQLSDMGRLTFGGLAPTRQRSYQFALSLPSAGSADNAYQGAQVSLGLDWSAEAVDTPLPVGTPTPTPTPRLPAPTPTPTAPSPTPAPTAVPQATPAPVSPTPTAQPIASVRAEDVIALPAATSCVSRRKFAIRVRAPQGVEVKTTTVYLNGRKAGTGRGSRAVISLRGLPRGSVKVKVVAVLSDGRRLTLSRTYRTCTTRGRR
jgi:cell division septation protein DedD